MFLDKGFLATLVFNEFFTRGTARRAPPGASLKAISKRRAARRAGTSVPPGTTPKQPRAGAEREGSSPAVPHADEAILASRGLKSSARPREAGAPAVGSADEGILSSRVLLASGGDPPAFDEGILAPGDRGASRHLAASGVVRPAFVFDDACKAGHVDCVDGKVRGSETSCAVACGDDCCTGDKSCSGFTGKVCKDGSCGGGYYACRNANIPHVVASCIGDESCYKLGMSQGKLASGSAGDVYNSCKGDIACLGVGMAYAYYLASPASGHVGNIINSCNAYAACEYAGRGNAKRGSYASGHAGDITDSCNTEYACYLAGGAYTYGGRATGRVGNITNSCYANRACGVVGFGYSADGGVGDIVSACKADKSCFKVGYNSVLDSSLINCCKNANECDFESVSELPDACTSSPPTEPPAQPPTEPPAVCEDDPNWYIKRTPGKILKACSGWRSTDRVYARDACKLSCDTCVSGSECKDDPAWRSTHKVVKGCVDVAHLTCDWAGWSMTAKRCNDMDANGTLASEACKATCGTC